MDDSLKGLLISVTVILLFITGILNFIVLFPQEQGVTFSGESQSAYLSIANNTDLGTQQILTNLSNSSSDAFDKWDITQGFMGSNQVKQGQGGVVTSITQVFSTLTIIATELFKSGSPVLYVLLVLLTLSLIVAGYMLYTFIRSGR